jgi:hypothetical protein
MQKTGWCVGLFAAMLMVCPLSRAQNASATLSGRIVDSQGAAVGAAKITVTNQQLGIDREVLANESGLFVITNLPPGGYAVRIEMPGFATKDYSNVVLEVGQSVTLDTALSPSGVNATQTVQASVEQINKSTSVVDGVIDHQVIENLPLNGRNYLELALLIPGNAPAPNFDPTKTNTVLISSAGQIGRGGSVTIDGADNNDDVVGGSLENISEDAVQEFQIATNRFSAEQGRSGSSIINVVTKSGTNQLHGSGSFFFRDRVLQGLPATFDRSDPTPPFDREQYSAALGGPIKEDKAWWFSSFEYRNQNGALLVGDRDTANQTITSGLAPAPLTDLLATERGDWAISNSNQLTLRYTLERANDTGASPLTAAIGSASERQQSSNHYQAFLSTWTSEISARTINRFSFSVNNYINRIEPVTPGPELDFPSIQEGASFRVPQITNLNRLQFSDSLSFLKGSHSIHVGVDVQRLDAGFILGVFQQGDIEYAENFPDFDRNKDGVVNDNDLLIAVTLRSATPTRPLLLPNADNTYASGFFQDDWRIGKHLMLNMGLRYEIDTDVKDVSRVDQLNPLILPFLSGTRHPDEHDFGPRIGFNWSPGDGRTSIHGGYGIYYDRVTLEIESLERGLNGSALAVEVREGNVNFLNSQGQFLPGAPTTANPFTGPIIPGAGAGGIDIIDNHLRNPMVQQTNLGIEREIPGGIVVRADYLHNLGTHFIIGRTIGTVFNPVVGGPDSVINLESSVNTKYDGLLTSVEKRFSHNIQFQASYTLSKAFNYSNDDQIPFGNGPIDSNNLRLEYGPAPMDQRHRFTFAGVFDLPKGFMLAPIWVLASGVPMDILVPDGSERIPELQRNAGGRLFHNGAQLNQFIESLNASGGFEGQPLPLVNPNARFNDSFNSFDLRLSRSFHLGERATIQPVAEVFNLFNVTNILGTTNQNYSGFANVLVRDSNNPADPGYLKSSSFGQPVTTAGGVFGSGGPRAFQLAVKLVF